MHIVRFENVIRGEIVALEERMLEESFHVVSRAVITQSVLRIHLKELVDQVLTIGIHVFRPGEVFVLNKLAHSL